MRDHHAVVDRVVVGADQHCVLGRQKFRRQVGAADAFQLAVVARPRHGADMRVVIRHLGAGGDKPLPEREGRALAGIVDILFVGDAERRLATSA